MSQIILEFNNNHDYRQIIQQEVKTNDFDDFMREFEESRQDKDLPFKNQ